MPAGQVFRQPRQQWLQWPVIREDATPLGTTDIDTPLDVAAEPGSTHDRQLRGAATARRRWSYEQYVHRPVQPTIDNTPLGTTDVVSPLDVGHDQGSAYDRSLRRAFERRRIYTSQYAQRKYVDLPFEQITGTVGVTLADTTCAASGTVGDTGTLAVTLGNVTLSSAGTVGDTGSLAVTLDAVTPSASGTVGDTGTLTVTLADTTLNASGASGAAGTLNRTLDAATSTADGSTVTGTVSVVLADITETSAGDAGAPAADAASGVSSRASFPEVPRIRTGQTVRATADADLGTITAYLTADVEFADEDLIFVL